MKNPTEKTLSIRERIAALDLDCIKFKLMDPDEGEGWPREKADEVEVWYRRFLFLKAKHPEQSIVVNKTVDTFWHYHILDTLKYKEDCEKTFGFFVHHFPYFGMRGEEDARDLKRAFTTSMQLFENEYGRQLPPFAPAASCANVCTSPCDSPLVRVDRPALPSVPVASCANVCTSPCDSPTTPMNLERPKLDAA